MLFSTDKFFLHGVNLRIDVPIKNILVEIFWSDLILYLVCTFIIILSLISDV